MPVDRASETDDADAHRQRGIRSFVLRAGRTTEAQTRALSALGPRWIVPYSDAETDWTTVFGRRAPRDWRRGEQGWERRGFGAWLPLAAGEPGLHGRPFEAGARCRMCCRMESSLFISSWMPSRPR